MSLMNDLTYSTRRTVLCQEHHMTCEPEVISAMVAVRVIWQSRVLTQQHAYSVLNHNVTAKDVWPHSAHLKAPQKTDNTSDCWNAQRRTQHLDNIGIVLFTAPATPTDIANETKPRTEDATLHVARMELRQVASRRSRSGCLPIDVGCSSQFACARTLSQEIQNKMTAEMSEARVLPSTTGHIRVAGRNCNTCRVVVATPLERHGQLFRGTILFLLKRGLKATNRQLQKATDTRHRANLCFPPGPTFTHVYPNRSGQE